MVGVEVQVVPAYEETKQKTSVANDVIEWEMGLGCIQLDKDPDILPLSVLGYHHHHSEWLSCDDTNFSNNTFFYRYSLNLGTFIIWGS